MKQNKMKQNWSIRAVHWKEMCVGAAGTLDSFLKDIPPIKLQKLNAFFSEEKTKFNIFHSVKMPEVIGEV